MSAGSWLCLGINRKVSVFVLVLVARAYNTSNEEVLSLDWAGPGTTIPTCSELILFAANTHATDMEVIMFQDTDLVCFVWLFHAYRSISVAWVI